ncbi:hypothetical protein FQN49_001741 [Arthroderma sp. PD_2]|nr:hypothetical protein FQN49_001741 [Arthroderma sp. PD_2]
MYYGQAGLPYNTPWRPQGGAQLNSYDGKPPFCPRSWNGQPRRNWNRAPPRYPGYNHPQVYSRPVSSYPKPPLPHEYNWQNGDWGRWEETSDTRAPALLSAPCQGAGSSDGYGFSAPPRGISPMVSNAVQKTAFQEKAFSEIMSGAFDLKKSPLCLGRRLANVDTNPASNWLLQQPNPFGVQRQPGKRAASSQMTPPTETHKKANSSSSSESNYPPRAGQNETITVGLGYEHGGLNPTPSDLAHLAQLIQQNTEQSTELKQLLSTYLNQRQEEMGSRQSTDRGCNRTLERPEENDGLLDPGPHVANGGGDSPDPPHDDLNAFRGHMVDCVEMASESNSKSGSDAESGSTKVTSIGSLIIDLEEKKPIGALDTSQCLASPANSVGSEDPCERKNRFERSPKGVGRLPLSASLEADCRRRAKLSRRAPSPSGSPVGKQTEFDFFPRSPLPGSPADSSTQEVIHLQSMLSPVPMHVSRPSSLNSSNCSSPMIMARSIDAYTPSDFVLPYYPSARLIDDSCRSWGSSPRSP